MKIRVAQRPKTYFKDSQLILYGLSGHETRRLYNIGMLQQKYNKKNNSPPKDSIPESKKKKLLMIHIDRPINQVAHKKGWNLHL